ncbi:hypothetical protein Cadr_000020182 [Camelus dromedarius]|uniref:Uncharacterized protein n=1 Tax=Camelus dromedarius TaxID=9838 RepID=A0A5N4CYH2_CAMDR|nr:hypothetical protein Cadr_000020182 [Camelus dromedarius]
MWAWHNGGGCVEGSEIQDCIPCRLCSCPAVCPWAGYFPCSSLSFRLYPEGDVSFRLFQKMATRGRVVRFPAQGLCHLIQVGKLRPILGSQGQCSPELRAIYHLAAPTKNKKGSWPLKSTLSFRLMNCLPFSRALPMWGLTSRGVRLREEGVPPECTWLC